MKVNPDKHNILRMKKNFKILMKRGNYENA